MADTLGVLGSAEGFVCKAKGCDKERNTKKQKVKQKVDEGLWELAIGSSVVGNSGGRVTFQFSWWRQKPGNRGLQKLFLTPRE